VYGEINAAFKERFFNLLGEHALSADLGKGNVEDLVTGGLDDFNLDFVTLFTKES
jgi:hypothetical protein